MADRMMQHHENNSQSSLVNEDDHVDCVSERKRFVTTELVHLNTAELIEIREKNKKNLVKACTTILEAIGE
jgi:hypothetical protein